MSISVTFNHNHGTRYKKFKSLSIIGRVIYDVNGVTKQFRFTTGEKCKYGAFKTGKLKGEQAASIDKALAAYRSKIIKLYDDFLEAGTIPNPEDFRKLIGQPRSKLLKQERDFFQDFESYVEYLRKKLARREGQGRYYIYSVQQTIHHFRQLSKQLKEPITYTSISVELAAELNSYCVKNNLKHNTYVKYLKVFKTFMNHAKKMNWTDNTTHTYDEFKVKDEAVPIIALTETEVEKIYNLDLSERSKSAKINYVELTRDYFVLVCELGLRFKDYAAIKRQNIAEVDNGYNLNVKTSKTGADVTIPLSIRAMEILSKYNFELPPAPSNQNYNDNLKVIARLAGIDKNISSHTSRKTFCTTQYRLGVPVPYIMRLSSHKTESEFYKYIGVSKAENADNVRGQTPERYKVKRGLLNATLKVA